MATSKEVSMRRFVLVRTEDVTGTSGTGIVAEGIEFSNGQVAIHWISQLESVNVYANSKVLEQLHGHDGRTRVQWLDENKHVTVGLEQKLPPSQLGPGPLDKVIP